MSHYQENIHIAILGPVSAGKSTLLNGLFATTYSQMKKKRTTMLPNIYQTTYNEKEVYSFEMIHKKNNESNENKMSNCLFYSPRCESSTNFIRILENKGVKPMFELISIDQMPTNDIIKLGINYVPTVMIRDQTGRNTIRFEGKKAFEWLDNLIKFREQNMAKVSVDKSTLLNELFATTYSQMKKKRTTMLPNIYQTTYNDKEVDSFEMIQKKNNESNENIFKLRESNQYNQTHFKEIIHKVKPIEDFIELPDKKATYKINDLPGINDQDAQIYYDYVKNNSHNIDVYILVFDINSPLNRTDEVKILQEITNHVKNNNHGYVHILINKCDDITFDNQDKFRFDDDENQESYDECIKSINKFMKDIMDKVTISPLRSSLLYTYRTTLYNIDSLDEKQIDNIIKEEEGKNGLNGLTTLPLKKKYLKGMFADKKKKLPEVWMKSTGYDLFKKYMTKILNNYQQIILYHIEQDVDKILSDIKKNNMNFDEISDNLGQINLRLKNLIQTTDDKCKVEEIIYQSIKTKLDEITQLMNNYIISGINTYSANTIENADSFLDKITKFFGKVSNIFKTNPLATSQDKLKIKRIELLNNKLSESFNEQIFIELYTNKTLVLDKYVQSVANTLDKNLMKFDKLLELVKKITNSDEKFMNVIINKFTSSYKSDTKFTEFLSNLELISNSTNNNLDVMWSIIECQLKVINNETINKVSEIYHYWINLNSVNILNQTDEIKYLMFKINCFVVKLMSSNYERFDTFKEHMNDIQNLYKLLTKLIGKKIVNIIDNDVVDVELISPSKQTKKNKLIEMTDDEFLDATEGEKTEKENNDSEDNEEKNDDYADSDDSDTVFRKATKNTSVRTTKRVNKGAKIKNLSK
jgi:GTPase Era involved in 16S rRNA processing